MKKFTCASVRLEWSFDQQGCHIYINIEIIKIILLLLFVLLLLLYNEKLLDYCVFQASSKVNVQLQSGLYSGLVDLDVPLDDLCHNMESGITLRAPAAKPAPAKVCDGMWGRERERERQRQRQRQRECTITRFVIGCGAERDRQNAQ